MLMPVLGTGPQGCGDTDSDRDHAVAARTPPIRCTARGAATSPRPGPGTGVMAPAAGAATDHSSAGIIAIAASVRLADLAETVVSRSPSTRPPP